jgi:hypothetical protein
MHDILNTYIYQIPPTYYIVCYTILGENIVLLGQKLVCLYDVAQGGLQNLKYNFL